MRNLDLDEETWGYVAGFLDGEGCFTVSQNWKIQISCSNTNKPVIKWLQSLLGGSYTYSYRPKKPCHRPMYRWQVVSKDAERVLRSLVIYLKQKQPQAAALLAIQQTMGKCGQKLSQEIKDERNRLAKIIKGEKHVAWS